MPEKRHAGFDRLDRGLRDIGKTIKDYAPVAKGVAKTFLLPRSSNEEENVDFSPGPSPKIKTPEPPKDWYKDSSTHKIPSYEKGTDFVPETGPAYLHKGEKVVSKEKNMDDKISKVASALGSAGKKLGVAADDSSAAGISAKNANIEEYKSIQTPASEPKPVQARRPSSWEKVGQGEYGSRKGEKRIDVTGMTKPLPSYKDGVDAVPEDGPAMLHKGEKIVPKKDNPDAPKAEKRVDSAMGGKKKTSKLGAKKGSKKTVHHVTVHKSATGGVVLQHEYEDGKTDTHYHPDWQSAVASMQPHFNDQAGGATPDAGQQMASPSSFEDGGVVEKSGMAMVHKGEKVIPAKPDAGYGKTYTQDITGTGPAKLGTPKPKPFVPFSGDPKRDRPNKKQTREEIDAIRKSGIPDSGRDNWMNNPKVAARSKGTI
jgi:hypothetical protein